MPDDPDVAERWYCWRCKTTVTSPLPAKVMTCKKGHFAKLVWSSADKVVA